MPRIFITYRRDESTGYAGRIHERLANLYGTASVFMDVDDIDPGTDFVDAIENRISSCEVLLVLVGKRWLTMQDSNGRRRIDDPNDLVRIEVANSLAANKRIIPVLLDGASMPAEKNLPDSLKALSEHQAIELSEKRWEYDFGKLVEAIVGGRRPQSRRRNLLFAIGGLALLVLLAALWWFTKPEVVIAGRWTAELRYEFGEPPREVFVFEAAGDNIRGTASFLEVDRTIVEGKLDGDMLSFITRTLEVAGDENREATHYYDGRVSGDKMRLVMRTVGGFSNHLPISFTARRAEDIR